MVFSTSVLGPKGYTYSVYIFVDTTLQPFITGESSPEVCRLAFYRWDGNTNAMLRSFGAPPYLPQWPNAYPVLCQPINWDQPDTFLGGILTPSFLQPADAGLRNLLGLNRYWSDINQNGQLEFAIYNQYCPNACTNQGRVSTHFYELSDTSTVQDITANLPGVFHPWSFVHSATPLDFYLYDPTLEGTLEFLPHFGTETYWIYAWDGVEFINVTERHAAEYAKKIEDRVLSLQKLYGLPLDYFSEQTMDEILVLSNKAHLPRKQILDKFLAVTELAHWPQTEPWDICWLQLSRAYAQTDYEKGQPFSLPPLNYFDPFISAKALQPIDQTKHDVSACLEILEEP